MLDYYSFMNIQGLCPQTKSSKVPYIRDLLQEQNQLFIGLSETWLSCEKDAELHIDNYTLFKVNSPRNLKKKRTGRKCGGVALYIRDDIASSFKVKLEYASNSIQSIVVHSNNLNITIVTMYRQPDDTFHGHPSTPDDFQLALTAIQDVIGDENGKASCIIMGGDFNLPHLLAHGKSGPKNERSMIQQLNDFSIDSLLSQIIQSPTHKDGNTLDLLLTNDVEHVHSHTVIPTLRSITDHYIIHVASKLTLQPNKNTQTPLFSERKTFAKHNFFNEDIEWDKVRIKLDQIDWNSEFSGKTCDEMLDIFYRHTYEVVKNFIPFKTFPDKTTKSKTERSCRNLTRRRRRINKLLLKIKSPQRIQKLHNELIDIECNLQKLYKNYKNYKELKAVEKIKTNPKYFYSYAKTMSKIKSKVGPLLNERNELISDSKGMANILAQQYSSVFSQPRDCAADQNRINMKESNTTLPKLTLSTDDLIAAIDELSPTSAAGPDNFPAIFLKLCKQELVKPLYIVWKSSLQEGYVMKELKKCIITPVHKGESKAIASNYRPVALTSHLIKVFEKVLRNHITKYLDKYNLLNPNQHGFRTGHSCLSELLDHYDNILNLLNEGKNVDVIYLDFAKAFDKVDFNIVLQKIKRLGIQNETLNWITSFLTNRSQTVVVNGEHSNEKPVISGVPQGSVLGPLIFLILLGDIDDDVECSAVRSFADDTRVMYGIVNLRDMATLQTDLYTLYDWTDINNMQLNDKKFELLRYGKDDIIKLCTHYYSSSGTLIMDKQTVKDLGVFMSASNNFDEQIARIIEKGKNMCSWIFRSFRGRGQTEMLTLWKSLVLPIIEYCSILWSPSKIGDIQKLEQLQWSFIRKIKGNTKLNYWECLKKLNMYSLQRRRERYQIIYVWKILEGLVPNVNNQITATINHRLGRGCNICSHTNKLKDQQISGIGVLLFNLMPRRIRDVTNQDLATFKSTLDKYLLQLPDEPHIPGAYVRRSKTNSLVDVVKTWRMDRGRAYHHCSS